MNNENDQPTESTPNNEAVAAPRASGGSSVEDLVTCPECDGSGQQFAMFIKYAEGHEGPPFRYLPCMFCQGHERVPAEMLRWREIGEEIQEFCRERMWGLREAASHFGLKPSEFSHLKTGRIDNTNWRSRFGLDR